MKNLLCLNRPLMRKLVPLTRNLTLGTRYFCTEESSYNKTEKSPDNKTEKIPDNKIEKNQMNNNITSEIVNLIDLNGNFIGIVPLKEALSIAQSKGSNVDVVVVNPIPIPPICKLFTSKPEDPSRPFRETYKRRHEPKQEKEIRFGYKIEGHDAELKLAHVRKFLEEGLRVKMTVVIKNMRNWDPQMGADMLNQLLEGVADISSKVGFPIPRGRMVSQILQPKIPPEKKKEVESPTHDIKSPTNIMESKIKENPTDQKMKEHTTNQKMKEHTTNQKMKENTTDQKMKENTTNQKMKEKKSPRQVRQQALFDEEFLLDGQLDRIKKKKMKI